MRRSLWVFTAIIAVCCFTGCASVDQPEKKGLVAKFEKDTQGRYRKSYLGPGSTVSFNVELSITLADTKKSGILLGTMELVISEGPASPNGNRTLKSIATTTFDRNPASRLPKPVVFKSVRLKEIMPSGELRTISSVTSASGILVSKKFKFSQDIPQWIEENKTYSGYDIIAPNEKVSWKASFEESRRISTRGGNFDCLLGNMKRSSKTETVESTGYYCPSIDSYVTFTEHTLNKRTELDAKYDLSAINIKPLR